MEVGATMYVTHGAATVCQVFIRLKIPGLKPVLGIGCKRRSSAPVRSQDAVPDGSQDRLARACVRMCIWPCLIRSVMMALW